MLRKRYGIQKYFGEREAEIRLRMRGRVRTRVVFGLSGTLAATWFAVALGFEGRRLNMSNEVIAPSGVLQVGINYGNPILATRNSQSGLLSGVSVDLARELGRQLDLPLELIGFESAGRVVDAVQRGRLDVVFLAVDSQRATLLEYTRPYVVIQGAYMVAAGSTLRCHDEVDRVGTRVVVGAGTAYDLFLSRALAAAQIVRAPTSRAAVDLFLRSDFEVVAGIRAVLESESRAKDGLRLLEGNFLLIEQAVAVPKGRVAAATFVSQWVEDMKRAGFVARSLARHGVDGAVVAGISDASD